MHEIGHLGAHRGTITRSVAVTLLAVNAAASTPADLRVGDHHDVGVGERSCQPSSRARSASITAMSGCSWRRMAGWRRACRCATMLL